jgi:hypothetical protein
MVIGCDYALLVWGGACGLISRGRDGGCVFAFAGVGQGYPRTLEGRGDERELS